MGQCELRAESEREARRGQSPKALNAGYSLLRFPFLVGVAYNAFHNFPIARIRDRVMCSISAVSAILVPFFRT